MVPMTPSVPIARELGGARAGLPGAQPRKVLNVAKPRMQSVPLVASSYDRIFHQAKWPGFDTGAARRRVCTSSRARPSQPGPGERASAAQPNPAGNGWSPENGPSVKEWKMVPNSPRPRESGNPIVW